MINPAIAENIKHSNVKRRELRGNQVQTSGDANGKVLDRELTGSAVSMKQQTLKPVPPFPRRCTCALAPSDGHLRKFTRLAKAPVEMVRQCLKNAAVPDDSASCSLPHTTGDVGVFSQHRNGDLLEARGCVKQKLEFGNQTGERRS